MISRSLKGLAKEMEYPHYCPVTVERGVESRQGHEGKRPQLADLRESGAIEQDADIVCFFIVPNITGLLKTNVAILGGYRWIIVAKHRNGPTGIASMRFDNEYAVFKPGRLCCGKELRRASFEDECPVETG